MLTGDQLRNERQVGDLSGGPAELEDDDEWDEVGQTGPLRGTGTAAQTLVEDEGEGQQHSQRTWINTNTEDTRVTFIERKKKKKKKQMPLSSSEGKPAST